MDKLIEFRNVFKRYHDLVALNDLSFTIEKGQIVGLVGENGSGKTTLMRALTGLIEIDSGEIFLDSVSIRDSLYLKKLEKVSALIENPALYLDLNTIENFKVKFMLDNSSLTSEEEEEKIKEITHLIGLKEKALKRPVKNFSLGMKCRLAIGLALTKKTDLLILDEPTNGLDPKGIIELRELLHRLNEEKMTIFVSSHILKELELMANNYLFISEGKIVKEITKGEMMNEISGRLKLTLNSKEHVKEALEDLGITSYIDNQDSIIVKTSLDITSIALRFNEEGIRIQRAEYVEPDLEDYYLKIIGEEHE